MKNTGRVFLIVLFVMLLISPIDASPDFVPVVGQVDDVLYIIGIIIQAMRIANNEEKTEAR